MYLLLAYIPIFLWLIVVDLQIRIIYIIINYFCVIHTLYYLGYLTDDDKLEHDELGHAQIRFLYLVGISASQITFKHLNVWHLTNTISPFYTP